MNEVNEPIFELTEDTQFQALENAVTPLCRIPYDKQLNFKQQWTNRISREIRSRVHNLKTPIRLPKVYPISPAVGIYQWLYRY
jgi:hypothetical protein